MADISSLMQVREEKDTEELVFDSACPIFVSVPKNLTEEQLKELEEEMNLFLANNKDGDGFIINVIQFGNAIKTLEEVVNKSKAIFRLIKPKWEEAKKGRKPLFDAMNNAMRRSDIILFFDTGLYTDRWLRSKVMEDAIEYRLRMIVRGFNSEGKEDIEFIRKRCDELDLRVQEAAKSFHVDKRPLMTDSVYDKLKHDLNELRETLAKLGG